jgi:hypothetical protein
VVVAKQVAVTGYGTILGLVKLETSLTAEFLTCLSLEKMYNSG